MIWKDFFFFSRGEKNGLLVLSSLICLMFALNFCFPIRSQQEDSAVFTREEQRKIDSLMLEIKRRDSLIAMHRKERNFKRKEDSFLLQTQSEKIKSVSSVGVVKKENILPTKSKIRKIELNRADSSDLVSLYGIGPILSKRIVKYRKSLGGKFHSVEQLKNVYGLSEETFQAILPYVWIDTLDLK